jgi:hypothetical protein
LVWHRDRYQSPAAKAFTELAVEIISQLAEQTESEIRIGLRPESTIKQ